MGNAVNINDWIVVKGAGSTGYLCKPKSYSVSTLTGTEEASLERFKDNVLEDMNKGFLEVCPCYDFMAPVRPVQNRETGQIAMQRDPVILPLDFTTEDTSAFVPKGMVMFLADLRGQDRIVYESFIQQVQDLLLRSRAQAAGIELTRQMPGARA